MEMNMKSAIKLLGVLVASTVLVACGGGSSSKPVKMVKVWKISEEIKYNQDMTKLEERTKNYYDNNGLLYKKEFIDEATGLVNEYHEYTYEKGVVSKEEYYYRLKPFTASTPFIKSSEVIEMDDQGTVKSYKYANYVNTYDGLGRLKKREKDRFSGSLAVDSTTDYTFNNDNTVEVIWTPLSTGNEYWIKYIYNNEGNLESVESRRDSSTGAFQAEYIFEYSDEDGDGRIDKHSYTQEGRTIGWVKIYIWKEYEVTEASTKQTVKGCRVKQGGCIGRHVGSGYGLPMMNYVQ